MAHAPVGSEAERLLATENIADEVRGEEDEIDHLLDPARRLSGEQPSFGAIAR